VGRQAWSERVRKKETHLVCLAAAARGRRVADAGGKETRPRTPLLLVGMDTGRVHYLALRSDGRGRRVRPAARSKAHSPQRRGWDRRHARSSSILSLSFSPKLRPTTQCQVGVCFLSNSFLTKAAMSFSMVYLSMACGVRGVWREEGKRREGEGGQRRRRAVRDNAAGNPPPPTATTGARTRTRYPRPRAGRGT
jgi:hypothetical protein